MYNISSFGIKRSLPEREKSMSNRRYRAENAVLDKAIFEEIAKRIQSWRGRTDSDVAQKIRTCAGYLLCLDCEKEIHLGDVAVLTRDKKNQVSGIFCSTPCRQRTFADISTRLKRDQEDKRRYSQANT